MKRSILACLLTLCAFFNAYGQNSPADVILLLDTSAGMSSSYETVSSYITGGFLSEFLRMGDTFHLIPYSARPRVDIARRVESRGDVETIIGRMLLQYPLESGNDAASAISFAETYAASLPPRPKKIVMVGTGGGNTASLVDAANMRLSSLNATLNFVQVASGQPLAALPSSGRSGGRPPAPSSPPAAAGTAAQAQPQTQTRPQTQNAAGASGAAQTQTQQTQPGSQAASGGSSQTGASAPPSGAGGASSPSPAAGADERIDTRRPSSSVSEAAPESVQTPDSAGAQGQGAVSDSPSAQNSEPRTSGAPAASAQPPASGEGRSFSLLLMIALVLGGLLILGLIIFFINRNLHGSPNRAMAMAASNEPRAAAAANAAAARQGGQRSTPESPAASQAGRRPAAARPLKEDNSAPVYINPTGPLQLNLFVEDQTTAIGKRNIHSLKSGFSLTVGGGKSDFLVFLVPLPANIGEIRLDAGQCTFIPHKPKYFPDLGSSQLRDCINKTIRVVSDKDYELSFKFVQYEDPLLALNRMLNSVRVPG